MTATRPRQEKGSAETALCRVHAVGTTVLSRKASLLGTKGGRSSQVQLMCRALRGRSHCGTTPMTIYSKPDPCHHAWLSNGTLLADMLFPDNLGIFYHPCQDTMKVFHAGHPHYLPPYAARKVRYLTPRFPHGSGNPKSGRERYGILPLHLYHWSYSATTGTCKSCILSALCRVFSAQVLS